MQGVGKSRWAEGGPKNGGRCIGWVLMAMGSVMGGGDCGQLGTVNAGKICKGTREGQN